MTKLLRRAVADRSGASAAEYALIIALVGGVIITSLTLLGPVIANVFTKAGTEQVAAKNAMN